MHRTAVLAFLAFVALPIVPVQADESFGMSLLRPDSLAGWDHSEALPAGWTIATGRLTGHGSSTPLLSGWTFGDFELRLDWSTAGGQWKLLLPEVPAGKGLELRLADGEPCGLLIDGERELAPGAKVSAAGGKPHTTVLLRRAGTLALTVDGKQLWEVPLGADRRFGLGLAVQGGAATIEQLRIQEPAGESMFDGRDFSGWWTPGNPLAWQARNGSFAWVMPGGNYVRSQQEFGNFTFSCEYKSAKGTNSGVGIRTPQQGWPSGDGMEMQLWDKPLDTPIDKHQTLAIYGNVPPLARNDRSEVWNQVVIKADGYMISAWMNGQLVQQYNTFHHPELKWRNLKGWIGFQDHGGAVEFRNIRVLAAPDGLGLDAWYSPRPANATTAMIDRLMNSGRLSASDGITSGSVALRQGQPQRDVPPKAEKASPKKEGEKKKKEGDKNSAGQKKSGEKKTGARRPAPPAADKTRQKQPTTAPAKPDSQSPDKTTLSGWGPVTFTALADSPPPATKPASPTGETKKLDPQPKKVDPADKKLDPQPKKADPADKKLDPQPKKADPADKPVSLDKRPEPDKKPGPKPTSAAKTPLPGTMESQAVPATSSGATGGISPRVEKKPELPRSDFVLAELTGPGAVVRIARGNSDGRLAFYFDGEAKARLECLPADLWKVVPELAEDANPVTTCLTYRKSLKIVLKGATGADYRIDYVKFPANYALETFAGPESGFPRGWLSALQYRFGQHKTGTVRKYAPLAEPSSPKTTIVPQQTQTLLHINGTGIVQWLKLDTSKQVLANNDLWLEVTVDGQSQPRIAAPARYWFPGLAGQGNWQNVVMLDRGGPLFRLAIPFGHEITVSARNVGSKPIKDVGLTMSIQMATEGTLADIQGRMRLHGVFVPAGETTTELAHLQGTGRWVGLVYRQPEGKATGIGSLTVDGQARLGWSAPDLAPFLGFLPAETRTLQSGRNGSLAWRYLMLECVDFRESLVLRGTDKKLGDRLVWYYAK